MILTLDDEMAHLVTDLKWADWTTMHTITVVLNENREVISAQVVADEDDAELLDRLDGVQIDHWSIGELYMDLLCSVAYGFTMTRPTDSHRYVLAMLDAIRNNAQDNGS